jgi:glycosyltransferase involved in cell wall biosynthesis
MSFYGGKGQGREGGRVLHIAPFLWSGAGQVITSLCESQSGRHEVAIVTTGRAGDQRDWPAYRRRLDRLGAPHTRINFFHRDPETFWQGVESLRRLVMRWRPAIVHAHAGVPACAAAAVRNSGGDFTLVNHLYSWGIDRPDWMNAMDLSGHRQADMVVCSADAYERHLVDAGVSRRRVVKLRWGLAPITLASGNRRPAARHEREQAHRIGLVGRIEPRKNQLALVEGFDRLRRQFPGATLELVGPVADEAYAARITHEIAARGLDGVVRMRGHVQSVPAIVSGWDLCVSLSSDEGQGLAILEAMALGVPVAARPVAGVEDYFQPGINGTAVRSARPADVASALARALKDPRQRMRMAARGRRQVRRQYSWDRTVAAIERVYVRAGARRGAN